VLQSQANAEGICWLDGFLSIALDSNSMSPIVRWDRPAVIQEMFDRRISPENAQLLGSWLPRQRYVLSALQELPRDKLMAHLKELTKAPAVANLWLSSQMLNIIEEKQRLVNLTLQHVSPVVEGWLVRNPWWCWACILQRQHPACHQQLVAHPCREMDCSAPVLRGECGVVVVATYVGG
jgi:hypothetical protein